MKIDLRPQAKKFLEARGLRPEEYLLRIKLTEMG